MEYSGVYKWLEDWKIENLGKIRLLCSKPARESSEKSVKEHMAKKFRLGGQRFGEGHKEAESFDNGPTKLAALWWCPMLPF